MQRKSQYWLLKIFSAVVFIFLIHSCVSIPDTYIYSENEKCHELLLKMKAGRKISKTGWGPFSVLATAQLYAGLGPNAMLAIFGSPIPFILFGETKVITNKKQWKKHGCKNNANETY